MATARPVDKVADDVAAARRADRGAISTEWGRYARRMGQPTQRATNHTARSHSHELPALTALAQHIAHSHSGIDEKRPTEKFVSGSGSL